MIKRLILAFALLLVAGPVFAQTFPELSGRVVDQADLLPPEQEAELTQRLASLEQASSRQLVVVTIPSLEGYEIEDYGYRLGRHWGIGQEGANNGAILLVAPNERRVRIEVGYGLEGILTDALSSQIINGQILPRFRSNDVPGGIMAGADALIQQLQAPPEAAEQRALEAAQAEQGGSDDGGSIFPLIFWLIVLAVIFIPMLIRGLGGRKYRGRRRRGGPIVLWGPGLGGWGGDSSSGWGGWSGGGGGGWSGGGGFSGGGGSFGGGGASGGW
jgi:uncharacterized protein